MNEPETITLPEGTFGLPLGFAVVLPPPPVKAEDYAEWATAWAERLARMCADQE